MKWILVILAVIYLLSPFDIIPGFHPAAWLDDIIVLILLLRYLSKLKQAGYPGQTPLGSNQSTQHQSQEKDRASSGSKSRSPYEILGVSPDADQKKIRTAYRNLANQYHPDKVTHLGEEFQTLAEQRFKEIQEAYDKLKAL